MTDIVFRFTNPHPSGADTPASGRIDCALVAIEIGEATRTIRRFSVRLVNGAAIVPLSPTPPGQAWRIEVAGVEGLSVLYKDVPASAAPIRYDQLGDIDPLTLEITEPNQAAWSATLAQVEAYVAEARELVLGGAGVTAQLDPSTPGVLVLTLAPLSAAPTITLHPQSATAAVGQSINLSAAAAGTPNPTVQWQISTGSEWSDIVGATTTTYQLPAAVLADSGKRYRAVFTNPSGVATSAAATLTVTSAGGGLTVPTVPYVAASPGFIEGDASWSADLEATGNPSPTIVWERLPKNATTGTWVPITPTSSTPHPSRPNTVAYGFNATTAFPSSFAGDTWRARARATNSQGTATSTTLVVSVYDIP